MELEEVIDKLIATSKTEEEKRYARITLDLGDQDYVGTDLELLLYGDYIGKITYTGSGNYFRLNSKRNPKIYCSEISKVYSKFDKLYFTNPTSQPGKQFIFYVGGAYSAELDPSTGSKVGLTDVLGSDINPSQEDGNLSSAAYSLTSLKAAIPSGAVYEKYSGLSDTANRFESTSLLLHDLIVRVRNNACLVGNQSAQDIPFSADESFGFQEVDMSTLYFKNLTQNTTSTVYILGTRR
ncbi:MAG: hypothetical protein EFT35_05110 [Methanophagales archaeon ANME-1-THS]|nr:MAG: hypothetical protein EFT35_05110 [Methanophagales archaeon ANME-1-THS]